MFFASAAASRTARRATGICSAARARTSRRWRRSAFPCRRASPSRRRFARSIMRKATASVTPSRDEVAAGIAHIEQVTGKTVRRCRRSAARLGPLRRPRLDAGDDGHGPQPGPQRRDGAGPRRRLRRSRASPGTAIAASSRCMRTWSSASITAPSRRRWRSPRRTRASISTPSSRQRTGSSWSAATRPWSRSSGTGPSRRT